MIGSWSISSQLSAASIYSVNSTLRQSTILFKVSVLNNIVKCIRSGGCMLSVGPLACNVVWVNVCCSVVIRLGNIAFHPEFEQLKQ